MYEQTGSGPQVLLNTTDKHNYTVTSLLSGTRYLFTVKPYNQAGEGPSAVTEVTTSGGELFCCLGYIMDKQLSLLTCSLPLNERGRV